MSQRIGDPRHAISPSTAVPSSGVWLTRASTALASPLSVLIVVPGLVVLVGLVLTLMADQALRGSNLEVARERLEDQAQTVGGLVRVALKQADPMLDRLIGMVREHDPSRPIAPFAHGMADLMQGRPGVTYVSVSFPDGTFQGAYLDDDRQLRFQDCRVRSVAARGAAGEPKAESEMARFSFGARGTLLPYRQERSNYDPRQRAFFKLALSASGPVWSEPYPFFASHQTGITRTQAVYVEKDGQRTLHAVVTVDFDVNAMSSLLATRNIQGMRAALYARDGTVLAYAGDELEKTVTNLTEDRTLRFSDLNDPVMRSFFAQAERVGHQSAGLSRVIHDGVPYLAVVARASEDVALDWSVAYLAPESVFLKELYRYQKRSLWVSASVLLAALAVAYGFARHVTRTRREIKAAKAAAQRAQQQVRELGSYRLVDCLGKGGMGEVWRAEHRLLAREAAVKLINAQAKGDTGELKARFKREAEALASLRSRHTIELYDYGIADDGTFFFVTELLDGMDLETLVNQHGAQPWERVVPLLIQVCSSLAEAHDAGLVHRDIKPANIFVCRAADELDVVKVLDFGLVRTVSLPEELSQEAGADPLASGEQEAGLTLSGGGAMGTPGFMPAEQIFGHELTGRADLYALGCVAHWLLSGHLVFDYNEAMARIVATISEELPDLRLRVPANVPESLLALIRACLSRSPEERPESARALADALRKVTGEPSGAWSEAQKVAWWAAHKGPEARRRASHSQRARARTMVVADDSATAQTELRVLDGSP